MRCEQIKELLSPYMDQMTNLRENQMIEAHLAGCDTCRRDLEQLQLVHSLLHNLDAPQLPERFTEEFHRRLIDEKRRRLFAPAEMKPPRKQGWIAAAVAGFALTAGIYASTFMPAGSIASLWQDRPEHNKKAPTVAVDDIIKRLQPWKNIEQPPAVTNENPTQNNPAPENPVTPSVNNPAPDTNKNDGSQPPQVAVADPQLADLVKSRVKVNSLADSVNQVVQIADTNGADSWVAPGTTVQAMAGSASREITIKAPRDKVKGILTQLDGIGNTSAPMAEQVELTVQYQEALTNIQGIDQEIKSLEAKGAAEDKNRIEDLKVQLKNWNDKKAQIERDVDLVTIKVYLVEEVKP